MDTTFRARATAILSPILSILIVVAIGIYASVRASALNAVFPFSCMSDDLECKTFSGEALSFYGAVAFLVCVVIVQIKSQVRRQLETESLLEETRALVRTAPPRQLLRYVNLRYNEVQQTLSALQSEDTAQDQDVAYGIRVILRNMLDIARYWDTHQEDGSHSTYRATVMVVVPASEFETMEKRQVLLREVRFADRNAMAEEGGYKHFPWYLRTSAALNTSTGYDASKVDTSIQSLILGLTSPGDQAEGSGRIMPGAPSCLYYGLPQYIANTATMAQRLDGAYFQALHSEIENFYQNDSAAKSLLSMPLLVGRGAKAEPWGEGYCPYIGVVNVFCDAEGMFGSEEASAQYSHLVAPFRDELGLLLAGGIESDVDFSSY